MVIISPHHYLLDILYFSLKKIANYNNDIKIIFYTAPVPYN